MIQVCLRRGWSFYPGQNLMSWNLRLNHPLWKGKTSETNLHFGVQNVKFRAGNPTILLWERDWDHQSYEKLGSVRIRRDGSRTAAGLFNLRHLSIPWCSYQNQHTPVTFIIYLELQTTTFLMDVWLNNYFPCKDLESSNWNSHFQMVVSGSRYTPWN